MKKLLLLLLMLSGISKTYTQELPYNEISFLDLDKFEIPQDDNIPSEMDVDPLSPLPIELTELIETVPVDYEFMKILSNWDGRDETYPFDSYQSPLISGTRANSIKTFHDLYSIHEEPDHRKALKEIINTQHKTWKLIDIFTIAIAPIQGDENGEKMFVLRNKDNEPIGYAFTLEEIDPITYETYLYIKLLEMHKSCLYAGLGKSLLNNIHCKYFPHLKKIVVSPLEKALNFYRKIGFKLVKDGKYKWSESFKKRDHFMKVAKIKCSLSLEREITQKTRLERSGWYE